MSTKGHPPSRTLFPRPRRPRWPGSQRHTLPPVSERVLTERGRYILRRKLGTMELPMSVFTQMAKEQMNAGIHATVRVEEWPSDRTTRIRVEHHPDERTLRFKTHAERTRQSSSAIQHTR